MIFSFLISACQRSGNENIDVDIFFGAETISGDGIDLYAENDSTIIFKGADFRTNSVKRSGNYSYITSPKNKFALGITIPGVKADNYVQISIWRKAINAKSLLIAGSTEPDAFYQSTSEAKVSENGWEQLELEFFIPPNYTDDELKIYVWNNSNDTIYFDDYRIQIKASKEYPVYNEQALYLETDTTEYLKLLDVRMRAFDIGILQTDDEDWVKGFVFGDGKMMKTKLRLKGDWLDHLYGDKWSFRLKLKSGNTWNRLRTFSLHNPKARNGADEWFLHKIAQSEGLLTTRYGFIPVYLNHKNLGMYAWEEHFTKQLVESQDKREGPIVRFFEDVYWDKVRGKKADIDSIEIPFFEAAVVKPFSTSKIVEDTATYHQFLIAQNLLQQYKLRTKTASEIFNIDALARYYALMDVFKGYHSIIWHNQRFYYNPVLCKLEPIVFDAYTELGFSQWIDRTFIGDITYHSVNLQNEPILMMRELFNDYEFVNTYITYLELYSSEGFLEKMTKDFGEEAMRYDSLIQMEFPELQFDIPRLYEHAISVRNDLASFKKSILERQMEDKKWKNVSKTTQTYTKGLDGYFAKNLVVAYKMKQTNDSILIKVVSYFPDPVLLLGVGNSNQKISEFLHPEPELDAYTYKNKVEYEFWIQYPALFLFIMAGELNETVTSEIMQWPEPDAGLSPLQELMRKNNFPDKQLIESIHGNEIHVRKGKITIDHPVIIPQGYQLHIKAGTEIDLVNKAMIISYAPVLIEGKLNNPVIITSSDFSGNGFTVLQAKGRSRLEHVVFKNLNTLDYKGWTLTGAVNFYESDVDITNTLFYRNQCEDALNIIRSEFIIDNSSFEYIYGDAFDSDFSNGSLLNTEFKNIGNDAIDFSGSTIHIENVIVEKANDKGISGGEQSNLTVENTRIIESNIGVASKDLSIVEIYNSEIRDCNIGLVLLKKKPEYGPGKIILINTSILNPKTKMMIEVGSILQVDSTIIKGTEENLSEKFY